MSAVRTYTIACDVSECPNRFSAHLDWATKTRVAAQSDGWVHAVDVRERKQGPTRAFDFCPVHADEVEKRAIALVHLTKHAPEAA